MSSIFISHSSSDNRLAKELERRLEQQGHSSVFLDLDPEKGIVGGQSWERTLYRKVRACRAVIALVTDDYLKSHWCFAEAALARMEGKHLFALKADPLSGESKLPSILTEKQYIDLSDDSQNPWDRLWRGLKEVDVLGVEGDVFDRPLETFSEGQRKKVDLCRSFLSPAHLLLWDEPLNYLDIASREQIEEVVLAHAPTLVFVEHDRRFVDRVATARISLG